MERKKGNEGRVKDGCKEEMKKCMWQVRKEGNRWFEVVA